MNELKNMRKCFCRWVVLLPVMIAPLLRAEDLTDTNKNQFTLFNPTPSELMRPCSTDRCWPKPLYDRRGPL